MMSDFRMHAMDPDDEEQEEEVVNTVPAEEHFRRLLNTSKERVLTILESTVQDQIYDHGEFSEHLEDLLDATRRTERLVKAGLLSEEEVQEAHMVLALAQLLPGMTYQSVIASLHTCLDVKTTAKGSLMELVVDEEYNFPLFSNSNISLSSRAQALFQLQTHLMIAAQPVQTTVIATQRPTKRRRLKLHTEYRASYWKVSLSYMLCQLAYDSLSSLPYPFTVHELLDRTQNLARPFGLHTSDLLVSAHAFFLLDLLTVTATTVMPRPKPEGLSLGHVVNELTARRYVA
jgi:hypothetical protein